MKVDKVAKKVQKKNQKLEYQLKELKYIKLFLKPLYEFHDYGNYPALVNIVKDLQIKLVESEFMCDA